MPVGLIVKKRLLAASQRLVTNRGSRAAPIRIPLHRAIRAAPSKIADQGVLWEKIG